MSVDVNVVFGWSNHENENRNKLASWRNEVENETRSQVAKFEDVYTFSSEIHETAMDIMW